jgi:hypothetical protein
MTFTAKKLLRTAPPSSLGVDNPRNPLVVPPATKLPMHIVLVYLLLRSPKLWKLLPIICDQIILLNEKSIIWCVNPAQQFFMVGALKLAGFLVRVFYAGLTPEECAKLAAKFTTQEYGI